MKRTHPAAVAAAIGLTVFLVAMPGRLAGQDYQVFGDVEGVATYHYLEEADAEHRLTGTARLRADHRLSFERAELVADTEIELRSSGAADPEAGFAAAGMASGGGPGAGSGSADAESELDYYIDEAYLILFPLSPVTVSAGKQRVNWGTGYTFTPTDTLHPRPTGDRDEGFRGASITWTPTPDLTLASHVSIDDALDDPQAQAQSGLRYSAYASSFLGNAEVFASGVYGPESTLRAGVGASVNVLGLVIAAEGAVELLNPVAYPADDGGFDSQAPGEAFPLGLAAVEYNTGTDIIDFTTVTEYLYAGTGYSADEAGEIYDALSAAEAAAAGGSADPADAARAAALGALEPEEQPLFLGRHYLGQTLTLGIAGYLEIEGGVILNASDLSYEAEQTVRVTAISGVDFFTTARWYGGRDDTEFGEFPDGVRPPGRVQVELGSVVHF
jgi:hypothetical protein